jgi:dihydrolipoamide dehydrogenase
MTYDLAIIGGGPAGYNAAERAAELGCKTILFEKNKLGGVCLNEGCIPTKTLLYSAKLLDSAKSASKYGIQVEGTPTADLTRIILRKDKVVRKLAAGVKMKLDLSGVSIVNAYAQISGEGTDCIQILSDGQLYESTHVLLCSGSQAIVPPIKGLTEIDFWTSKEALESKVLPQSLVVVGGGVIGMEFASFFNSMGVKVSVVEMLSEIVPMMDRELAKMLRSEYTKKGVDFYMETKVVEVRANQVSLEKDGKVWSLEAEKILMSVGRRPIVEGLGLEKLNIECVKNAVQVNEFMQTSHPKVYACGDMTGFSMLAHTAIREGEVAVNHISGVDDVMSYSAIPSVVYTNPEMAGVGKTQEELNTLGVSYRVKKLPMAYSGRFVAENETGNGLCKLLIDDDGLILGLHLLGNPASELIEVATIAVEKSFTVDAFKRLVFPHPTVGEIIRESLYA